jgi:hypothetical protein
MGIDSYFLARDELRLVLVLRFAVERFLVAAPFLAAMERAVALRLRVAAPFFAAADLVRDAVVDFLAVERFVVARFVVARFGVDFFAVEREALDLEDVDRDEAEREVVDFFAAPPFLPPRFDGVVSFFLPRPEPLFFPPPSCALTVA